MKVTFLLPDVIQNVPVGGFRVAFEYANRLSERGYAVHIFLGIIPELVSRNAWGRIWKTPIHIAMKHLGFRGGYHPSKWFPLSPKVFFRYAPLHHAFVAPSDIIIATAWHTAERLATFPKEKGKKAYFIQGLDRVAENQDIEREKATWKLPLHKIVISNWLKEYADSIGEEAARVYNGLDFDNFYIETPIETRSPKSLATVYHPVYAKGFPDAIEAIKRVKAIYPETTCTIFGSKPLPADVPNWCEYINSPSREEMRKIYNRATIFVNASWSEGWGLTPCEAAQCGAARCLSDINGHREHAAHQDSALLSPIQDSEAMAKNILSLIEENDLRWRIAKRGAETMNQFRWEKSVAEFEKVLQKIVAGS
jgi:glycosyltransferase involved in cell wall biosynthesis